MNKHIFVSVSCANEFLDERAETFAVEITCELINRIKELSGHVKESKGYEICEFNYSGVWSKSFVAKQEITVEEINELMSELAVDTQRVECPLLNVSEEHFYWSCIPKHCSDDMALRTSRIPISFIENGDIIFFEFE